MFSHNYIPPKFEDGAKKAAAAIAPLDNVIIAAHVNPDGDALGSMAAMGWMLSSLGRNFALYSCTGVPGYLDFMELPGTVYENLDEIPFQIGAAIYLDCSESHRLGHELGARYTHWPSINIDHHLVEHGLGSILNFIDPAAAATAQLVAYIAMNLGLPLTGQLADSVCLGLMTDTGGFCHGNTTADVFALCAYLTHHGCKINDLREHLHNNWTVEKLRIWGTLLSELKLYDDEQIALCTISQKRLDEAGCRPEDLEGLVEWFRKIRGVKVAAIMREEDSHKCKFSLRSYGPVDVRAMAAQLGGGGHQNAAGGLVHKSLDQASVALLETISEELKRESL